MNPTDLALYEHLADKTLKFGCLFKIKEDQGHKDVNEAIYRITSDGVEWFTMKYESLDERLNRFQYFREGKYPSDKDWRIETEGQSLSYLFGDFDFQEYCPQKEDWIEAIGSEPTIADLHKWLNERFDKEAWYQDYEKVYYNEFDTWVEAIRYDSSLPLMQQSEETKLAILEVVRNHK